MHRRRLHMQTIVCVLIVLTVLAWDSQAPPSAPPGPEGERVTMFLVPPRHAASTPSPAATRQATVASTPTPHPTSVPTVPRPTPTPTPTPLPTATPTPRPPVPPLPDGDASVIVERGTSGRAEIALTFDAGEGSGYTAEILDLLDDYGVSGSFGVTGQWAEQNPELLQRIVDEGHMLINHTYDHRSWSGESTGTVPLTASERREEVVRTDEIIRSLTGYDPAPYFRFPYGDYDWTSLEVLHDAGYGLVLWYTCDTLAWNGDTAEQIVARCGTDRLGAGDIVLMHVVQAADIAALPVLIEDYLAHGFALVTMEELIQP